MTGFVRRREAFPAAKHVTYLDLANKNILLQSVIDGIPSLTGGDKGGWKRAVQKARI